MTHVLDLFDLSGKRAIVTGAARPGARSRRWRWPRQEQMWPSVTSGTLRVNRRARRSGVLGDDHSDQSVDATQSTQIVSFVQKVIDDLGANRHFVNNVGIGSQGRSLEDEDEEFWRHIIDTNLSSMFYVAKPVAST